MTQTWIYQPGIGVAPLDNPVTGGLESLAGGGFGLGKTAVVSI
jgi:hypothetical protein